ncbi:MAG: hypothetical protein EAZ57_05525 [Cytophagales bacterium]|nr:MAG: hypothetical protein EAZ67_12900 [Cytophagales bacterium]TAF61002.1 MAG: hypothetical protein EAZ57_05525 [Cytophagales bacterium]
MSKKALKVGISFLSVLLLPFIGCYSVAAQKRVLRCQLTHNTTHPYSHNAPYQYQPESHLVIILAPESKSNHGSLDPGKVFEFNEIKSLPCEVNIEFDSKDFPDGRTLRISAVLHLGAGNETYVGDLISEYQTTVNQEADSVNILLFGMEDCKSANAGGFCTTLYRNQPPEKQTNDPKKGKKRRKKQRKDIP